MKKKLYISPEFEFLKISFINDVLEDSIQSIPTDAMTNPGVDDSQPGGDGGDEDFF